MDGGFLMQVAGRSILNWDVQVCQVKHQQKLLLYWVLVMLVDAVAELL